MKKIVWNLYRWDSSDEVPDAWYEINVSFLGAFIYTRIWITRFFWRTKQKSIIEIPPKATKEETRQN